jgi:hypothetical protein
VSLVVSLGLLVARRESGHAVAGGIFLGLLTRHLLVYRQRIWKRYDFDFLRQHYSIKTIDKRLTNLLLKTTK